MRRILWAAGAALSLLPRLLLGAPDISVQMTVDVAVPAVGQPVHFNVTVANLGADAATDVQVTDQLPAELRIPTGMAAFPSTGTYDAATGVWSVGSLAPGANAALVLPAVVVVTNQPACSVNIAVSSHALDANRANDRASAAVRRSVADRCVDLSTHVEGAYVPYCVTSNRIANYVRLANAGPDAASNVFIDLIQDPVVAPRLRLTVSGAEAGMTCSGTRCTITSLAAGATIDLAAESDPFLNSTRQELTLGVAASSTDTDYATANNQSTATVSLPAVSTACNDINIDEGWGVGAGAGCFIATAAYGSALDPHVMALREFRDRYLQHSAPGRAFIRFYYRYSPPVAAAISRHESLRFAVRAMLTPLVLAVAYPLQALVLLIGAGVTVRFRKEHRLARVNQPTGLTED
jgi:uncharacterized repeat protein (TIGR01451 family)